MVKQTELKQILNKKVVGIVGEPDSGKTTLLIDIINKCQVYECNKVAFFYHEKYKDSVKGIDSFINNIDDLMYIENSFIFIDEFKYLFELEDRHQREVVENILNMIQHNNNILVLCGLPTYYNQLISKHVKEWLFKRFKFKDCVNGTILKQYAKSLKGEFNGGIGLNICKTKALTSKGFINVGYCVKSDKKAEREDLFKLKGEFKK